MPFFGYVTLYGPSNDNGAFEQLFISNPALTYTDMNLLAKDINHSIKTDNYARRIRCQFRTPSNTFTYSPGSSSWPPVRDPFLDLEVTLSDTPSLMLIAFECLLTD